MRTKLWENEHIIVEKISPSIEISLKIEKSPK